MKTRLLTTLALLGLTLGTLHAADAKKHDDHAKVGPTNGRLITAVEPHVEFLVTKDRTVELRFVDDSNKVVTPSGQEITVTLGERSKPTKLTFKQEGDKLVSSAPIPAGDDLPTVVQIREKAGAKPVNAKFNLDLGKCPTCENAEYACKCEHREGDEKEHKHDKK